MKRTAFLLMVVAIAAISIDAQQRRNEQRFPPRQPQQAELAAAKGMIAEQLAALDREIAARMLRRADTPSDRMAMLEMEIDWRLLRRWMLQQAHAATSASDAQIAAALRAQLLESAASASEELINRRQGNLTPAQVDAMAALHRLTFVLGEAKEVKQLDEMSRKIGVILAALAGVDEKTLPMVRPRPMRAEPSPSGGGVSGAGVAALADEIRRLNLSIPLRQQLAVLSNRALAAAGGDDKGEAGALAQMLAQAVEMSRALHHNIGVSVENRVAVELQLAEIIALFLDPRTRSIGQQRLDSIRSYRDAAGRIERLKLSPQQMAQFSPLFAWAQQRPGEGGRALEAVETFVQLRAKLDARASKRPSGIQGLARSQEELLKHVTQQAANFETTASDLARGGVRTIAELDLALKELSQSMHLLEILERMPVTLDALSAFKPKGFGNLERRIVSAAAGVWLLNAPNRDASLRFIEDVDRLAQVSSELGRTRAAELSPVVDPRYGIGRAAAVEGQWRNAVADLASSAAMNGEIDSKRLSRLDESKLVFDVLRQAASVEAALKDSVVLGRWADWRIHPDELQSALAGYYEAVGDLLSAAIAGTDELSAQWDRSALVYRGLVAMVARAGGFREQCAAYPAGPAGIAAALITPFDGAPYAAERYVSFAAQVWRYQSERGDEEAEDTFNHLLRRAAVR